MDLEIKEKKDNSLLSRTELCGKLAFSASTPSKDEVRKTIASKLHVAEQLVVVKEINTKFGARAADLCAYIYKDEATLKRIEPKLGKKAIEKAAKKAGQQPAAAAQPAPAEKK